MSRSEQYLVNKYIQVDYAIFVDYAYLATILFKKFIRKHFLFFFQNFLKFFFVKALKDA